MVLLPDADQKIVDASSGGGGGTGVNVVDTAVSNGWMFPVPAYTEWNAGSFMPNRTDGKGSHPGVDIYAEEGAPVRSPVSGTVIASGTVDDGGKGGNWVQIQGEDGNIYYFAHMQFAPNIPADGKIFAGVELGKVGNTGSASSTSPHLHFTMKNSNGDVIDPIQHLQGATMTGDATQTTGGAVNMPTGGALYEVDGEQYVMYQIVGLNGVSAALFFSVAAGASYEGTATVVSQTEWDGITDNAENGGSSEAFRGAEAGQSFDDYMEIVLMEMGIFGTDALGDAGVLAVIAKFMARDMSPEEMQARLQETDWWNDHTEKQLSWNDKSDAQQGFEIQEQAAALVGTWFTYTGQDLDMSAWDTDGDGVTSAAELQAANQELYDHALAIASGTATQATVVNNWIKPAARGMANSPWNRTVENEEKAQGQGEVDAEQAAGQVMDLYRQWGFEISWGEALSLGESIRMNQSSLAELAQGLDEQAMALYPEKPPGVTVMSWSQPYRNAFGSVLEIPDPELTDPMITAALSDGLSIGEFRKQLKQDDRWGDTKNARDEVHGVMSGLGNQMGF
jgi:hypothetical protein